jgi:hypothetical protein
MAMATSERFGGSIGQIVAELNRTKVDAAKGERLCLEDGEHLTFRNHVVNADEYRFEFARCR